MSTHQPPVPPVKPVQDATSTARIDAVQQVLTRTLDALAGYDKMLPGADPDVAPILRMLRETHHSHASQLGALITALGGTPDMDGSLMGTVNKAVVSVRAMFDGIDDDALERAVEGERHVTAAFADAMAELPEGRRREDLARMKSELDVLLAEARAIVG